MLRFFYLKGTGHTDSAVAGTESQELYPVTTKTLCKPPSTVLLPVQNPSVETFCHLVEQETFHCLESGDSSIRTSLTS